MVPKCSRSIEAGYNKQSLGDQNMNSNPYKRLAERLDALPNGYPPTEDGVELELLAKLFTPDEADIAARLRLKLETAEQIAARLLDTDSVKIDSQELQAQLKTMARKGLITAGRSEEGLGFGLMPFIVGIYEAQIGRVDVELASLFERYYKQTFGKMLTIQPAVHRVIPVGETVRMDIEIQPFESVNTIVSNAKAWGLMDCICRVQKSLIGEPCDHPIDVCMALSKKPGAFDKSPAIKSVTLDQALATLDRAAQAGLVHSVSNSQQDITYICNCCTCSCGVLRGIVDLGVANVIARSAFINQVDEGLCVGCEDCIASCQFEALSMLGNMVQVNRSKCVGCGVCVPKCMENALGLIRRPPQEILPIPVTEHDWRVQRATARGQEIANVM
jgi:electron transport complex protein RnfB